MEGPLLSLVSSLSVTVPYRLLGSADRVVSVGGSVLPSTELRLMVRQWKVRLETAHHHPTSNTPRQVGRSPPVSQLRGKVTVSYFIHKQLLWLLISLIIHFSSDRQQRS